MLVVFSSFVNENIVLCFYIEIIVFFYWFIVVLLKFSKRYSKLEILNCNLLIKLI